VTTWKRWRGEPRRHEDINHIKGCISRYGCRCAGHSHLNPNLPEYLRGEEFEPGVEAEETKS
jgi:hypothetical protein